MFMMISKSRSSFNKLMNDDEKITCVLVDSFLAWNMEAAAELGIKRATICCLSATQLLSIFDIPKLIQHGVIDNQEGDLFFPE
ncbi:hypothetical protein Dsin_011683 [Dipteronia sinensis]|uniref:Uncharacterized protein n=1 Tax=Dipteronia sinensis TaxID=43782 RepID=A0AAE0AH30_9ROSI|nr:hypothetical protein Dsin_011683 [Dipteronia sinensis]